MADFKQDVVVDLDVIFGKIDSQKKFEAQAQKQLNTLLEHFAKAIKEPTLTLPFNVKLGNSTSAGKVTSDIKKVLADAISLGEAQGSTAFETKLKASLQNIFRDFDAALNSVSTQKFSKKVKENYSGILSGKVDVFSLNQRKGGMLDKVIAYSRQQENENKLLSQVISRAQRLTSAGTLPVFLTQVAKQQKEQLEQVKRFRALTDIPAIQQKRKAEEDRIKEANNRLELNAAKKEHAEQQKRKAEEDRIKEANNRLELNAAKKDQARQEKIKSAQAQQQTLVGRIDELRQSSTQLRTGVDAAQFRVETRNIGREIGKLRSISEAVGFSDGVKSAEKMQLAVQLITAKVKEAEVAAARLGKEFIQTNLGLAKAQALAARFQRGKEAFTAVGGHTGILDLARDDFDDVKTYLTQHRKNLNRKIDSGNLSKDELLDARAELGRTQESSIKLNKEIQGNLGFKRQAELASKAFLRYAVGYGAGFAVLSKVEETLSDIVQYEDSLKQLQAVAQITDKEMEALSGSIEDVAKASSQSIKDVAAMAQTLAQAGVSADKLPSALRSTSNFARATGSAPGVSADVVTSAQQVFSELSFGEVSDLLTRAVNLSKLTGDDLKILLNLNAQTAKASGQSLAQLLGSAATLRNQGISGSTIATGSRELIQELTSPDDKFVKFLTGRYAAAGEFRGDKEITARFQSFQTAENPLVAALTELKRIGVAGAGRGEFRRVLEQRAENVFLPLIDHLDELQKNTAGIKASGAAAEGARTRTESLSAAFTKLGAEIESFANKSLSPLFKALSSGANSLSAAIEQLGPKSTIPEGAKKIVSTLYSGVVGLTTGGSSIGAYFSELVSGKASAEQLASAEANLTFRREKAEQAKEAFSTYDPAKKDSAASEVNAVKGSIEAFNNVVASRLGRTSKDLLSIVASLGGPAGEVGSSGYEKAKTELEQITKKKLSADDLAELTKAGAEFSQAQQSLLGQSRAVLEKGARLLTFDEGKIKELGPEAEVFRDEFKQLVSNPLLGTTPNNPEEASKLADLLSGFYAKLHEAEGKVIKDDVDKLQADFNKLKVKGGLSVGKNTIPSMLASIDQAVLDGAVESVNSVIAALREIEGERKLTSQEKQVLNRALEAVPQAEASAAVIERARRAREDSEQENRQREKTAESKFSASESRLREDELRAERERFYNATDKRDIDTEIKAARDTKQYDKLVGDKGLVSQKYAIRQLDLENTQKRAQLDFQRKAESSGLGPIVTKGLDKDNRFSFSRLSDNEQKAILANDEVKGELRRYTDATAELDSLQKERKEAISEVQREAGQYRTSKLGKVANLQEQESRAVIDREAKEAAPNYQRMNDALRDLAASLEVQARARKESALLEGESADLVDREYKLEQARNAELVQRLSLEKGIGARSRSIKTEMDKQEKHLAALNDRLSGARARYESAKDKAASVRGNAEEDAMAFAQAKAGIAGIDQTAAEKVQAQLTLAGRLRSERDYKGLREQTNAIRNTIEQNAGELGTVDATSFLSKANKLNKEANARLQGQADSEEGRAQQQVRSIEAGIAAAKKTVSGLVAETAKLEKIPVGFDTAGAQAAADALMADLQARFSGLNITPSVAASAKAPPSLTNQPNYGDPVNSVPIVNTPPPEVKKPVAKVYGGSYGDKIEGLPSKEEAASILAKDHSEVEQPALRPLPLDAYSYEGFDRGQVSTNLADSVDSSNTPQSIVNLSLDNQTHPLRGDQDAVEKLSSAIRRRTLASGIKY